MTTQMLAEIAYSAYWTAREGKDLQGNKLAEWYQLDEAVKRAWIAAASAIRNPKLVDLADRRLVEAFDRLALAVGGLDGIPNDAETIEICLIDRAIEQIGDALKAKAEKFNDGNAAA